MESRIKKIMANVFLIDESEISENTSQDDLSQWDSMGHLNLITALEEDFGIYFSDVQISEMLNFKLIIEVSKEAINSKN